MAGDADLVLVGGTIFTASLSKPWAKAFAVRGDRIVAVGTDAQAERWASRGTRTIDLKGRVVVPGFIDAHAHMAEEAGGLDWSDLAGARSLDAAVERLRAAAASGSRGQPVIGVGWDEAKWPERRYLSREDLDRVAKDRPVVAVRVDWHIGCVNSFALESARDLVPLRGYEVDATGRPTGVLKEEAFGAFWSRVEPDEAAVLRGLPAIVRRAHRLGITSIHDVIGAKEWRAYQRAHRSGRLGIRVYGMLRDRHLPDLVAAGFATGLGDSWLRLGAVKVFSDGSLGAYTANLAEPYEGRPGDRGMLVHAPEELRSILGAAHCAGFQTATHAIGDAAIRVTLDAIETVQREDPRPDARHRIEHYEMPDEPVLERTKAAGVVPSCQPNFVGQWSGPFDVYETRLGLARSSRNNPYRPVVRAGLPLCFGSDGMPYGPLYGLHWAVNGFYTDQRLTVEEAVRAYTAGGANASFEEGLKGTLEPGKLADFVVLGGDPFREPARIRSIRVESTWIGGRRVHGAAPKR